MPDAGQHRREIARVLNLAMKGMTNASFQVTLTPNQATTTVIDARFSLSTAPHLVPLTAAAATEAGAGALYVVPTAGQCVINHTNSAVANRTFAMSIVG